ncbi:MAG: hypothetical protein O2960_23430 [Verrucomicrobia bacterium]|nr:hypothetical protein [Verrucomicrobiota bacterium]
MGCGGKLSIPASTSIQARPSISEISNQGIDEGGSKTVVFTIGDRNTPLEQLRLSALSSNPAVVPTNSIVFTGLGAEREITIEPVPNAFGRTTITINVSNGVSETNRSFQFMVWAVHGPPIIEKIDMENSRFLLQPER